MSRSAPHATLTQSIAEDLGKGIVTGRFEHEGLPSEQAIADRYGAARTITREAIKMLAAKGLVRSRTRMGILIEPEDRWNLLDSDVLKWLMQRPFSIDTLIEFTEFRLGAEPNAARLAAMHATDVEKSTICTAVQRMYDAEQGKEPGLEADIGFHVAVLEASRNRFCLQMREFIAIALTYSIQRTNSIKGEHRACASDHDDVAKAILAGRPERAERAMYELIERALTLMHGERVSNMSLPAAPSSSDA